MKQEHLCSEERTRCLGARHDWVPVLALPVVCFETCGKSLNLSESSLLHSPRCLPCLPNKATVRSERLYEHLAWSLAHSRHFILLFFSLSGVWMAFKEDTAEIIHVYAKKSANNFSATLQACCKILLFRLIICSSCLTGGKLDQIHLWVRTAFCYFLPDSQEEKSENYLSPCPLNFQDLINFYIPYRGEFNKAVWNLANMF